VSGVDFDADKIRVAQATARFQPGRGVRAARYFWNGRSIPRDCELLWLLCDVLHYFPRELKAEVLRKVFQRVASRWLSHRA